MVKVNFAKSILANDTSSLANDTSLALPVNNKARTVQADCNLACRVNSENDKTLWIRDSKVAKKII